MIQHNYRERLPCKVASMIYQPMGVYSMYGRRGNVDARTRPLMFRLNPLVCEEHCPKYKMAGIQCNLSPVSLTSTMRFLAVFVAIVLSSSSLVSAVELSDVGR